ncbi:unnamed protein product [Strongylus vulgaris]|uniref:Uncharacterized protein n=1 Tax=Strongylus vulgaris TaxID=40348 RepID=A0A3P7JCU2_STRVU|nr:unnamed protein product [Strongylus vulgaris]
MGSSVGITEFGMGVDGRAVTSSVGKMCESRLRLSMFSTEYGIRKGPGGTSSDFSFPVLLPKFSIDFRRSSCKSAIGIGYQSFDMCSQT